MFNTLLLKISISCIDCFQYPKPIPFCSRCRWQGYCKSSKKNCI